MRSVRGFTFIEVLAILLVLSLGITSVVALLGIGRRQSGLAQMRLTGAHTATSMIYALAPGDFTADIGDADDDGWSRTGSFSWTGSYAVESKGHINGMWVVRTETSAVSDIISGRQRNAWVTVEVYWGLEGDHVTTFQERILRQGAP